MARHGRRGSSAVIEITDSGVYSEPLAIALEARREPPDPRRQPHAPVLRLLDYMTDRARRAARSTGKQGSRFMLDGLIVTGRGIQVIGPTARDAEQRRAGRPRAT